MSKIQKVCMITGASSGLGFETSKKMAALGYEVILACRNDSKAKLAISKIKRDLPDARLIYMNLDLSSFRSIEKFCGNFHLSGKKLNVLINNAAWMDNGGASTPSFTEDKFEMTFGVNHLGHFLLTTLLLDVLQSTGKFDLEARVVIISSDVQNPTGVCGRHGKRAHLDIDDIQLLKTGAYNGKLAYKNSKLANVLFAYELNRRLDGTGVTCNVLNPGFIPSTNVFRNQNVFSKCCMRCFFPFICSCKVTTVSQAASSVVFVASDSNLRGVSGKSFVGREETDSSLESEETDVARQLWELSERMVAGVTP